MNDLTSLQVSVGLMGIITAKYSTELSKISCRNVC